MTFSIGPFLFSLERLALLLALFLGLYVFKATARYRNTEPGNELLAVILFALLAARMTYIARYWSDYADDLSSVLYLFDGGYSPLAGLLAAALASAFVAYRNRHSLIPLLAGAASSAAALAFFTSSMAIWQQGQLQLDDVHLVGLDYRQHPADSFRGKPVVVNLWASWCPPCRHEMPVFQKAQREMNDVSFVFANQGENATEVRRFLMQEDLSLMNVFLDSHSATLNRVGSRGLPVTLFFNEKGVLERLYTGEMSYPALQKVLREMK